MHLTQILVIGDTSLDINSNSSFLTQPSTLLYSPRDLKSHFFKLSIISTAQLLFLPEFILYPFSLHTDILRAFYLCLLLSLLLLLFF